MTAIHARFSSTTVDGIKSQTTGSRFSETTQRPSVASNNTYNNAKSRQEKQRVNNRCRGNKLPPTPKEWRERITDFYLIPDGPFLSRWNAWMVAVTTASHLLITFMAAFHIHSLYGFIAGFFIDVIFLVDMYFKSHTVSKDQMEITQH